MSFTITATPEPNNVPPRVRLNVTESGSAVGRLTVTRQDPDGSRVKVRTFDNGPLVLTSGTGLLYDYEMPLGVPVAYQEQAAAAGAAVTVTSDRVWLVHPGVPEISMPITVAEFGAEVFASDQSVLSPLGRKHPIVVSDGQRKAPAFELRVYTKSLADQTHLEVLLDDVSPLLLNVPASKGFGVQSNYVSAAEVSRVRVGRAAAIPDRFTSIACQVVARPAGGSQATRTWTDVTSAYATWNDVMAAYPTWFSVLAGP